MGELIIGDMLIPGLPQDPPQLLVSGDPYAGKL
jgi:hypothetical protein